MRERSSVLELSQLQSIWPGNLGSTALSIDHLQSFVIKYLFSLFAGGHSSVVASMMSV